MDKYRCESEAILRTAMSKFPSPGLKGCWDPNTIFFETDKLVEKVERHG